MALNKPIHALVLVGITLFLVSIFVGTEEEGGVISNATALIVANNGSEENSGAEGESTLPAEPEVAAQEPVTWAEDDELDDPDSWTDPFDPSASIRPDVDSAPDFVPAPTSRPDQERSRTPQDAFARDMQRAMQ